ncbi:hypothetical protein QVD17_04466 [Tagetes erecta]|uniref:DUF4378 domain-containing protein n=1 Tax=Tagetes erecta TaxID=13708 RepID=A0AAD8LHW3_TARER|nr:hypothetical protein QVD17_04466 [Tagetes erecta]
MVTHEYSSRFANNNISLPVLLKDHLLDDLSSCSSNGFRSYPRRQCCTKVRYLIQIDLNNKHPPSLKSKSKSSSVLRKASTAVVNVFRNFHFSSKPRKPNLQKLSKHGLWKKSMDQNHKEFIELNFDEEKEIILPTAAEVKTNATNNSNSHSNSNSNSSLSVDSYFTATSDSSTVESDKLAMEKMNLENGENASSTNADGNAKEKLLSEKKDHFSPNSVMEFPCDDENDEEDEVTSPFHDIFLNVEGSKRKVMPKVHRTKTLKPVRLEDRIILSESKVHGSILEMSSQSQPKLEDNQTKKKATALLQLFKATMPSNGLFEPIMTENFLFEFFTEQVIEGKVSNYTILQDAKDWVNGVSREMFDSDNYKLAYIRDMEKRSKWLTYDDEVEKEEVVSVLESEVFTSLVEDMLLDLYS